MSGVHFFPIANADYLPGVNQAEPQVSCSWGAICKKIGLVFLRILLEIVLFALSPILIPLAACFKKRIIALAIIPASADSFVMSNRATAEEYAETNRSPEYKAFKRIDQLRNMRAADLTDPQKEELANLQDEIGQDMRVLERINRLGVRALNFEHATALKGINEELAKKLRGEEVQLTTSDGLHLEGMFFKGVEFPEQCIIFMHGNGRRYQRAEQHIQFLRAIGTSVLVYNRRGVGFSEGFPLSACDLVEDGKAALEYLVETRGIKKNCIQASGISMGGFDMSSIAASAKELYSVDMPVVNEISFSNFLNAATGYIGELKGAWPTFAIRWIAFAVLHLIGWGSAHSKRAFDKAGGNALIITSSNDPLILKQASLVESLFKDKTRYTSNPNHTQITDIKNPLRKITCLQTELEHFDTVCSTITEADQPTIDRINFYITAKKRGVNNPSLVVALPNISPAIKGLIDFYFDQIQQMRIPKQLEKSRFGTRESSRG